MEGDWVFTTIRIVGIVAIVLLAIGMIYLARAAASLTIRLKRLERSLQDIGRDARPVFDRARAIGENLNFIVMSVRKEVDRVSDTIALANDRLEDVLEAAEDRVQDLNALIDVVQGEVEDTVITATSALRGIRTGARVLRRRGSDSDDSDSDGSEE
ncbi:MAG: hypothetical protein GWN99_06240 [Gemmatimonadetes bacterium]|uniref:DUF948 domain-containing protein n=1 Tax=Candidatus Kutchimonas denitrificans TaxID=3056748 RepID=A0AAE4Z9Q5_9BACT|nr:hypothetical protein [Gemmatimonadota bacterium]NIR76223.1 hypothetical protein [Candidatus Kutchimonas denitrificans]NIS00663.1 hypothetical protein [Gemmatimonadota bacterium]NIT66808.1 hypothetical protein [Gemmatimonadota bacterium]NIV23407.1 hypothetical protein [Gemmatimonadota bacterium]